MLPLYSANVTPLPPVFTAPQWLAHALSASATTHNSLAPRPPSSANSVPGNPLHLDPSSAAYSLAPPPNVAGACCTKLFKETHQQLHSSLPHRPGGIRVSDTRTPSRVRTATYALLTATLRRTISLRSTTYSRTLQNSSFALTAAACGSPTQLQLQLPPPPPTLHHFLHYPSHHCLPSPALSVSNPSTTKPVSNYTSLVPIPHQLGPTPPPSHAPHALKLFPHFGACAATTQKLTHTRHSPHLRCPNGAETTRTSTLLPLPAPLRNPRQKEFRISHPGSVSHPVRHNRPPPIFQTQLLPLRATHALCAAKISRRSWACDAITPKLTPPRPSHRRPRNVPERLRPPHLLQNFLFWMLGSPPL